MTYNRELAGILSEMADVLEFQGVEWKPRAYRNAARQIETLDKDVRQIHERDGMSGLLDIPGIGKGIAGDIVEYIQTGKVAKFEEMKANRYFGAHRLAKLPGIGPKKAKMLSDQLNINTIEDLKKGLEDQSIRALKGFGEKTEKNIALSLSQHEKSHDRFPIQTALGAAEKVIAYLKKNASLDAICATGSLRRMKETIGDIDIVVMSKDPPSVMDAFVGMPAVARVISKGPTRSTAILHEGIQVDVRVIPKESYGSALLYFTGSKDHNIRLRKLAMEQDFKLSEYGLFNKEGTHLEGRSEELIYKKLGLSPIPPELREDQGEVEAALQDKIPRLIDMSDIKGDLHIHTKHSDGFDMVKDMALNAQRLGYEYIAITDHSQSQKIAHGLSVDRIQLQWDEIKQVSKELNFPILKSSEVDILPTGELDYPNDILDTLDIVIASVHSGFKSGEKEMTDRLVAALKNKHVTILGHPTGRLIGKRPGYNVNLDEIFSVASRHHKVMEISADPKRLDLNDALIRQAKKYGLMFSINTDAHSQANMSFMKFGVGQARRGWITRQEVINAKPWKELIDFLTS